MAEIMRYDGLYSDPDKIVVFFYGSNDSVNTLETILQEISSKINRRFEGQINPDAALTIGDVTSDYKVSSKKLPSDEHKVKIYSADVSVVSIQERQRVYNSIIAELGGIERRTKKPSFKKLDIQNNLPLLVGPYSSKVETERVAEDCRDIFKRDFTGSETLGHEVRSYLRNFLYQISGKMPSGKYIVDRESK